MAAFPRSRLSWVSVFYTCGGIIACNFMLLLTYREPKAPIAADARLQGSLWRVAVRELTQLHVWTYLLAFTGFWFMFNALFDVLPLHVQDWVDHRTTRLVSVSWEPYLRATLRFLLWNDPQGTQILPEGMLNINAGLNHDHLFLRGLSWVQSSGDHQHDNRNVVCNRCDADQWVHYRWHA